jgi:hypothetical protein
MSSFCKQCSVELFSFDARDLANITTPEQQAKGLYSVVLCEDCGIIQVDKDGKCLSITCLKNHGKSDNTKK